VVRQDDDGFDPGLNGLLNLGDVGAWTFVKILITNESLYFSISLIKKRASGSQDECFIVLQEHERSHILVEFLVGVQREGIWVVTSSSNFELFKSDFHFIILAFNLRIRVKYRNKYQVAICIFDYWVLHNAVIVWGELYKIRG
jgi:hypothetical protein